VSAYIGCSKNLKDLKAKPRAQAEEMVEEREKYAWEMDDVLDTGMTINAKGQVLAVLYILFTAYLLYSIYCALYSICHILLAVSVYCTP
jgi:hypothetical protein